jgi:RecB family exonuclease
LTGRIDRIDRVGASEYDVIDYKTGGYWRDSWKGVYAGGSRLQHALYGIAAVELLRVQDPSAKVRAGVYLFTSAKGGQERVVIPNPSEPQTASVLEDLLAVVTSGTFVHTADEDDCSFCDYGRACGAGAPARARLKLDNASELRLDGFRKLARHE